MTGSTEQWSNWGRSARAFPTRIERPQSTEELRLAVVRAAERGERVRPVGAGFSTNAIAAAPEVLVDTRGLRGLRAIDRDAGTATFGAGTTVAEASALLEAEGLALVNPSSDPAVTLAGAMATGSHGTSLHAPSVSSQLLEATLVTADGGAVRVSDRRNAELWPALRLSLGALGVFAEVVVPVVPTFRVRSDESRERLRPVLDSFVERARASHHFAVRWRPHTGEAFVRRLNREVGDVGDEPEPGRGVRGIAAVRDGLVIGLAKAVPALVPAINAVGNLLHPTGEMLAGPVSGLAARPTLPVVTMEYSFPLDDLVGVVRELDERLRGVLAPSIVRLSVAPADDNWLSTAYGREVGRIMISVPSGVDPRSTFTPAEELFLANGGLPHWGMVHTVRAAEFAHVVSRFSDFHHARERLDPDLRFTNGYLQRVLGH
ncbi:L-gulonolactone oxidase [Pseudoclavibacter chungangensis]|uniref:D-arabinono-1,4-lactone oxidase n=1 Tax=Pseudoclavibacter chungangensis TaxID=587635 RepID=UPI0015C76633|nr:D-arabinono-1,4-lactone oxidase [Pseudoclavibacter chungangensis]NYJ67622.1 L-gulonolactone oxidase [Pseudoclavibacter chungangensis]